MNCRSISMRGTSEKQSLLYDSHDSSTDSLSLFGNVLDCAAYYLQNDEPLNVKVRMVYNQLRRAFVRLSPDLQKIVGVYFIAIHILLFFAIVLQLCHCLFVFGVGFFKLFLWSYTGLKQIAILGGLHM